MSKLEKADLKTERSWNENISWDSAITETHLKICIGTMAGYLCKNTGLNEAVCVHEQVAKADCKYMLY